MNKITVDEILKHKPCNGYSKKRLRDIVGDGVTVSEWLDLDENLFDSPADKYWVLCRPGILPGRVLHRMAIFAAEMVLPIYEAECPGDRRPRIAIETKKRWLDGLAMDEELRIARKKTWGADAAAAADVAADVAAAAAVAAAENIYQKLFIFIKEEKLI